MWTCFMVEETDEQRARLRRHSIGSGRRCSVEGHSWHDAMVLIEDQPLARTPEGFHEAIPVEPFFGDPRWPTACECGYEFDEEDSRMVHGKAYFSRLDGEPGRWTLADLPPGAMFDTPWLKPHNVGLDGLSITVKLPPGVDEVDVWHVDFPASSGGGWARTGVPPKISVTPSILSPRYHSFLTDGVLGDSLPDRPL